ncbi:putative nuclease HARBI1 isoform X2 [Portunus trituberculatus]|uniref:putative nuclease HARBI1 isoform X2 n=1 Tax=Portunus trituberculatus TaxID=210409 RepID=UPI001E1CC38F|nr:putative nuclease HARBI1 isoform X2 [Portunus trituberculatus]
MTFRFYASGSFQSVLADTYGLTQGCVSRVINRVKDVLYTASLRETRIPRGLEEARVTKRKLYGIANFPNVIGIIDGTHIPIAAPPVDEELYINRKNFHSLNIQVVCNADYIFQDYCCRSPGSTYDSFVWENSILNRRFQRGEFGDAFLLGDSGYPVNIHLMTPIGMPANAGEQRFNISLKKTRVVVE